MTSVIIVMLLIIVAINALNYRSYIQDCDSRIDMIQASGGNLEDMRDGTTPPPKPAASSSDAGKNPASGGAGSDNSGSSSDKQGSSNGGSMPDGPSGNQMSEALYDTRYFSAQLDSRKQIISTNMTDIASISTSEAENMISEAVSSGKSTGGMGAYRYRLTQTDSSHYLIIFLNVERDAASVRNFLRASMLVGVIGVFAIFILMKFLTKLAMAPAEAAFQKQKMFITDASHEIKTPLAIISSNAEVIEMENGGSKWLTNIKNQITRLTSLTEKLVLLARMDEAGGRTELSGFDLAELVKNTAGEYQGKHISLDVPDFLPYYGSRENMARCLSMIFDNAMKYATGDVSVCLKGKPYKATKLKRHGYTLTVSNPCEAITPGSLDNLFDRFARFDKSRIRKTGGSGIGLAVVAEIVRFHKGEAHAFSKDGKSFEIRLTL